MAKQPKDDPYVLEPDVLRAPAPPAQPAPVAAKGDPILEGVKKGDLVRLLVPHYDGYQLLKEGDVVRWWNDEPPSARNVARAEDEQTPLTAPAMTSGKPPDDYLDPTTGKKPVITSV